MMTRRTAIVIVVAGLVSASTVVFAEPPQEGAGAQHSRREEAPGRLVSEEAKRLRELKQTDPEAFQQAIQERKAKLRERLAELKETNPEKFEQVKERLKERRQERLENLKENNPEKFQELMAQRKAKVQERLEDLKTSNPERYEPLMEKGQEWRARKQGRG